MKTKGKSKRQRQEENKERMKRRRIEEGAHSLNVITQDDGPAPTAEAAANSTNIQLKQCFIPTTSYENTEEAAIDSVATRQKYRSLNKQITDSVLVMELDTGHGYSAVDSAPVAAQEESQNNIGILSVPDTGSNNGITKTDPFRKWDRSSNTTTEPVQVTRHYKSSDTVCDSETVSRLDISQNQTQTQPVPVTSWNRSDNNCVTDSEPVTRPDILQDNTDYVHTSLLTSEPMISESTESNYHSCLAEDPGLSTVCHEDKLSNNVLYGELPIEVLDLSSMLLKKQFNVTHGLLRPSYIYAHILTGQQVPEADRIPSACTAVQMHFVPYHYILSYQFMKTITIYDSVYAPERIEQVLPQLKIVYKGLAENPETPINYCIPQHQLDSESCGIFAIAFTVALLLKQIPLRQTGFLMSGIRQHLLKCLKQGTFSMFTTVPDEMQRLQNYFQSQADYQKSNSKLKAVNKKRLEEIESKQRKFRNPQQKEQGNAKCWDLMRQYRQQLNAEQREEVKAIDRHQMRQRRKSLSEGRQEEEKVKTRDRVRQHRKGLSESQREEVKARNREQMRQQREDLSDCQKEEVKAKTRDRMRQQREGLSEGQKKEVRARNREQMRQQREGLSEGQREEVKAKDRDQRRLQREGLSEGQREEVKAKDRDQRRQQREGLSEGQREEVKEKDREQTRLLRKVKTVEEALHNFRTHILEFAEYVCTCCNRMLYRKSVIEAKENLFRNVAEPLRQMCLSGKLSAKNKEWLCKTCQSHIMNNKLPPQANANNLALPDSPPELNSLSSLEERLLSQRYPFMKLLALPKGRQRGIKGAVVNVPVQAGQVCEALPRTPSEAGFLPLKLKRKVQYSGHVNFQYIRPNRVKEAFRWLKANNVLYSDIEGREEWEQRSAEEDQDTWAELTTDVTVNNEENTDDNTTEAPLDDDSDDETVEEESGSRLRGIKLDSCIQPDDPSIDVTSRVMSIAPGEGKRPINMLNDEKFEELAFPTLFPSGKFGLTYERPVSISAKKYFQRRILEHGGKFASNTEYLFVGQFLSEWQQIRNSISVALRKSFGADEGGEEFTAAAFKNPDRIRPLLMKDEAYRFLRPVRGSPPYWQQVMFKLLSAIKQLKIFTWFMTLSAADLRWTDTLQGIARQQGRMLSEEQIRSMTWEEKCELLRSNPVTAARHFHHKLQSLFTDVILSDAAPLGKITNYFYRIEFQQRGSPHAHAILWVEEAPQPDSDTKKICEFVDEYVSATIPVEDDNLQNLVTELQRHSCSASCKKRGNSCRFNFPRPPSEETILARPEQTKDIDSEQKVILRKQAHEILNRMKECMENHENLKDVSLFDILTEAELSPDEYNFALLFAAKDATLHLKRKLSEVNINNYNAHLLTGWQANMDLQYVVSPYAAIHYITSYVTKDEREMGLVLQAVSKEMSNLAISKQMSKVADAFANSRAVSAQEAVYRLLGLPLYQSNFKTVWIPTGYPERRVRILKSQTQLASMEDDEPDIFLPNLLERYAARPAALNEMCLAEFSMWYEVTTRKVNDDASDIYPALSTDTEAEKSSHVIVLSNNLGKMKRKTKPNVIRFHQCSMTKEPEMYFYNKLLLYLPWKNEKADLQDGHESHSEHFDSKKDLVESNENRLMSNAEMVDEAVENFQEHGPPTHAWDQVAPETQHEEADALEEGAEEDEGFAVINPDANENLRFTSDTMRTSAPALAVELIPDLLSDLEYRQLVQSLNTEQRNVFQYLLNWCENKKNDSLNTDPECIFVTGGAGTGKSHLIKAVHNMANFVFRKAGESPSETHALLMAPTGPAAFNIGAPTIHSALLMPRNNTKTYIKLSDDKCNTLRAKLKSLQMVIIDEISMVGNSMILHISKRLQQITGVSKPFGGLTVLAFGDLYQLPPVGQSPVYELPADKFERLFGSIWVRNFKAVELTEVMRQKEDAEFAELLNRVRKAEHTEADIDLLRTCEIDKTDPVYKSDVLHIFKLNVDKNAHNSLKMGELNKPILSLKRKEKRPSCLKDYTVSDKSKDTGGLEKEILICEGCRVMLVRNIDVQDGLVNGAQGTVLGFIPQNATSGDEVKAVVVQFDKANVGSRAIAESRFDLSAFPANAVPITRMEVKFSTGQKQGLEITWLQFPMTLGHGSSIHKVQGSTHDEIVVCFKHSFLPGQAYVALSRSRTLKGLQLLDFNPENIRASSNVKKEMKRLLTEMRLPSPYHELTSPLTCPSTRIALLNANSAKLHFKDITTDPVLLASDILAITETHITNNNKKNHQIDNYRLFMKQPDMTENHHGIALYVSDHLKATFLDLPVTVAIEVLSVNIQFGQECHTVVLLYRSPSVPQREFAANVETIVTWLTERRKEKIILLGDFNFDWLKRSSSPFSRLMDKFGFRQIVKQPTHRMGSCLDHIYLPECCSGNISVLPTYYSDHYFVHAQVIETL